ncbi:MAG TPA: hypothetical protein VJP58_09720 [Candidatus Nitrosocosmicus sp.]|nr:hypothetical protein [Candidatus Nitrosocosmicus sp.]
MGSKKPLFHNYMLCYPNSVPKKKCIVHSNTYLSPFAINQVVYTNSTTELMRMAKALTARDFGTKA